MKAELGEIFFQSNTDAEKTNTYKKTESLLRGIGFVVFSV
jgi:hypothetical protein